MQMLSAIFIPLMIFSFLQLYNLSFSTWGYAISSVISILTLTFGLAYAVKIYKLIKENDIDDKQYMLKYEGLYRMYKDQEAALFECVTILKKFFFSFFLVFLNDFSSVIQLGTQAFTNTLYLVILIRMRPYRNKKVNIIRIISESIYTMASYLNILLLFLVEETYLKIYKNIGWIAVGLYILVICLEMTSLILIKKKKLVKSIKQKKKLEIKKEKKKKNIQKKLALFEQLVRGKKAFKQ